MNVLSFRPQSDERDFEHFRERIAVFRRCGQEVQIAGLLVFVRPTAPSEDGGDWATPGAARDLLIPSQSRDVVISR